MNGVAIRAATQDDAPLLAELHATSFNGGVWSLEQIRGSLALATTKGWVAETNGNAVGFILCQIIGNEAEILTFCVRPEHRRQKIGTRLLRQVLLEAKTVFLEVAADNAAACALYEKFGFTISGRRENYYWRGTGAVDAVMYRLTR